MRISRGTSWTAKCLNCCSATSNLILAGLQKGPMKLRISNVPVLYIAMPDVNDERFLRNHPQRVNSQGGISRQLPGGRQLLQEVRSLIDRARRRVAQKINSELVMLNWHIGNCIRIELLRCERAEYGKSIVETLSEKLTQEYGRGYSRAALFRMVKFAEVFPDLEIVSSLMIQLSWTQIIEIIYLKDELRRNFYVEMCVLEGWSVRTLQDKIKRLLFERTAIARKPEDVAQQELKLLRERGELTPDLVFRDPYLLDFLRLTGSYDERDIENAIVREMEQFLLEMGTQFSFVARQKRISVDDADYYLDLQFYHRRLRRLVAIELKLGPFKPEHKGQMEFYLRWLDKYERCEGEEAPVGLILCAGRRRVEEIELLGLNNSDIRVAEIITDELPIPVLSTRFHDAIKKAQEQIAARSVSERSKLS
jgi:predicted nuclease of restriction endonuclease-like (RecB) superfamily